MSDRPILMSAPMVRALLDGRKTQTRRLAWRETKWKTFVRLIQGKRMVDTIWQSVKPGDRLWVRENHAFVGGGDPGLMLCEADWRETAEKLGCENIPDKHPRWIPCIHMFKKHSRITLIVTATKMERVQEISEEDSEAEGAEIWPLSACEHPDFNDSYRLDFQRIWQFLHTKPGVRWGDNPEVIAIEFETIKQNIDATEPPK